LTGGASAGVLDYVEADFEEKFIIDKLVRET
jgi:hypothetical protein